MRVFACTAALVGAISFASSALAEPTDKQRAAELFAGGEAALKRGDFPGAGAAFEQAALYAPHPSALLNAAEAWELAGDVTRAAELCDRALAMNGHHGAISPSSGNGSTPTLASPSVTSRSTWPALWQAIMGVVEP